MPDDRSPLDEAIDALVRTTGLDFGGSHRARMVRTVDEGRRAGADAQTVVDGLTVGETYFFRDPAHLDVVREAARRRHPTPQEPLRVWSAGCATGEEAYTLAIVLEEEGLLAVSRILGTDLSATAVGRAGEAVYGAWSLRRLDAPARARYFEAEGDRYRLRAAFTRNVDFVRGNLLDGPPAGGLFDLVVCRNVLIYLTTEAVARAAGVFLRSLAPGGRLIVGASDPPLEAPGLARVRAGSVVVYRAAADEPAPPPAAPSRPVPRQAPAPLAPRRRTGPAVSPTPAAAVAPPSTGEDEIARVLALAERGDVEGAIGQVTAAIAGEPLRVDLRHLAALVHLRAGDPASAAKAARAALFLEPDSAVVHLTLAQCERLVGDAAGARRRIERARDLLRAMPADVEVPLAGGERAGVLAAAAEALAVSGR